MGRNYDYSLTEEQMAAYLDGMLNAEQSNLVEEIISSDFDMQVLAVALERNTDLIKRCKEQLTDEWKIRGQLKKIILYLK